MIPILTFTRGEFARELVRVGDVIIGEVSPHNGRDARATFSLRLPECRSSNFRPATSIEDARRIIVREVSDWFLRAGVFYPGQDVEVELRGIEGDREARRA